MALASGERQGPMLQKRVGNVIYASFLIMYGDIVHSPPFVQRVLSIKRDILLGTKWRIPLCCIFFFLLDQLANKPSGLMRGGRENKYGSYVPCPLHMKRGYRLHRVIADGKIMYNPRRIWLPVAVTKED